MKKLFLVFILIFLTSQVVFSQAISSSKFIFDQSAPDLISANGYTYKYYSDGSLTPTNFIGVTCVGTNSPFVCSVNIPAFTPGTHTVQFTATNIAGESAKSSLFSFTFVVTPSAPLNIRLGN